MQSQTDLSEVAGTRCPGSGLTDFLDRRQQQAQQDRDDGNNHQQFNEREPTPSVASRQGMHHWILLLQNPSWSAVSSCLRFAPGGPTSSTDQARVLAS